MNWIKALLENEAALSTGAVVVVANLLAVFGVVELSGEQVAAVNGLLAVVAAVTTRASVWSEASHRNTEPPDGP